MLYWLALAHAATLDVGVGQPYATIAEAVDAAAPGDVVAVHPGRYELTGSLVVDSDLTVRGVGGVPELVGGEFAMFDLTNADLLLEGLDITPAEGVALWMHSGDAAMLRLVVHDGTGRLLQGGDAVHMDDGNLLIEDSQFLRLTTGALQRVTELGGAIFAAAGVLDVRGSSFEGNAAGAGGAIRAEAYTTVTLGDCTFTDNFALVEGGAAELMGQWSVQGSRFENNHTGPYAGGLVEATGGALGLVCAGTCVDPDLSDNVFIGNSVNGGAGGGAVYARGAGGRIARNTFCGNDARKGGGLQIGLLSGYWQITNNVFDANTGGDGAAIFVASLNGAGAVDLTLQQNAVLANVAEAEGGAVRLGPTDASIVKNNVFVANAPAALTGLAGSPDYNLWYDNVADVSGVVLGAHDVTGAAPGFVGWSSDGVCENDVLLPAPGSPLVDAGDPALLDRDGSRSDIGPLGGARAGDPPTDADADGVYTPQDCDDTDDAVRPGATEVCNGVDDDCADGADGADAVDPPAWYADLDGDGFGSGAAVLACGAPEGHVAADGDCDDGDSATYPGAEDAWYDGVIHDCDRASDYDADGDLAESPLGGGDDCDDADPAVYPGASDAPEDGVDADCDGADASGSEDDAKGCGCETGAPAGWLAALLVAGLRRRR